MFDVTAFRAVLREEIDAAIERALDRRFGATRLSKTALAHALQRTPATVDRFVRAGMPHETDGAHRTFDLDACRAWLRDRPAAQAKGRLEQGVVRKTRKGATRG